MSKDNKPKKIKIKKGFWEKIWNKHKIEKKNHVAIIFLHENGNAEPMEVMSEKGFFQIKGKTYHERRDCIYTLGKERYPLAIIPEWSLTPIGTKGWEEKTMQEKLSILQDHAIKGIRHAERVKSGEDQGGIKLNAKAAIGIAIAAVIVIAVIMSYV